jgi:hypothetical protein
MTPVSSIEGVHVVRVGCFKDKPDRAIPNQVNGLGCGQRGIQACQEATSKAGLNTFSMQWPEGGC